MLCWSCRLERFVLRLATFPSSRCRLLQWEREVSLRMLFFSFSLASSLSVSSNCLRRLAAVMLAWATARSFSVGGVTGTFEADADTVKSGVPKRTQFIFVCPFCRWTLLLRDLYIVNILFNLEVSCWSDSVFTVTPRNSSIVRHLDSGRFSFLRKSTTSIITPWVNYPAMGPFRRGCQLLQLIWIQKMVPENLVLCQMRSNVSARYANSNINKKEGIKIFICTTILAFSSFLHDSFYFTLQANALQRVVFSDLQIQWKQVIPRLACLKSEKFQLQQKLVGRWYRKTFWWSSPLRGSHEDHFHTTQVLIIWKRNKINWPWTYVGLRKNGLGIELYS